MTHIFVITSDTGIMPLCKRRDDISYIAEGDAVRRDADAMA